MATIKTYRTCFVPLCGSTTKSTPNKVFATVPQDVTLRKKWFNAVRRDNLKNSKSNFFCCEDHFNLREDMENYQYYMMMGGSVKIRKNVIPHKFECQPDRKHRTCSTPRIVAEKRQRRAEINEILTEAFESSSTNAADASEQNIRNSNITAALNKPAINELGLKSRAEQTFTVCEIQEVADTRRDVGIQTSMMQHSVGVQVKIRPHYRSVYTTCNIPVSTVNECCSPIKLPICTNVATSPTKPIISKMSYANDTISTSTTTTSIDISSSHDYYMFSDQTSLDNPSSPNKYKRDILNVTNYFISTNMKAYLGIPNKWKSLLHLLSTKGNVSIQNIQLCLMKIRRQDTLERLAEQFCISPSNASIVFNKTVPILSHLLKTLIFFPNPDLVKKTLPIPFRSSYNHVQSIVDALEIQIEKPSDPVNQALTWSEYKKCNTIKYLISCGPDGFINFISTGYGGRISDVLLFEKCGILDQLPEKCAVMADRGFKNIKSLLAEKHCELIKPPSVSSTHKPTKSEVLETKRIASLRIHVERVIGRLREFDFLKPHAVINHSMLSYTDDIIVIASALINLHSPIIKK
ncbi:uncharacterized protein [Temnothorax longispinosus]|uniref:uncharacterized protein n=1 Tax=Temnothorax longispinosus TaxID=300112 RepID=UPI003A9A1686